MYDYLVKNPDQTLHDLCLALDDLSIKNLELMEEKIKLTIKLENLTRQGNIEMAKARYIRGKESIGMLQVPHEDNDMKSVFELETSYDDQVPNFDISLRTDAEDPIKWFGVLVPQSLRSAQKYFREATYAAVELANINGKLLRIMKDQRGLRDLKKGR
ncbi:coiled-coil domain-containing protein 115 isoform X2 [Trichogramma pretiosum]|uniref:coiled-coil domain-containing protein 115 isoform X2 n=1 Tax=Trichogramma pretiosum TaxID=7493 RepID=UPI0006C9D06C|nr:coiled-coil domain-containing protein 115 isoform X2 [Trichogramma pretiosum]